MELTELLDEDQIPEYLGGKLRVNGDPQCRYAIKATKEWVKVPG